jgi:septum formation protein
MLILASKSKARYELLKIYNAEIKVIEANIDESFESDLSVEDNLQRIAYLKAQTIKNIYPLTCHDVLIAADTICLNNDQVLFKPNDYVEAFQMLKSYSQAEVRVITGVYLEFDNKQYNFFEDSTITFDKITDEQIKKYLDNNNYLSVAGALAIEKIKDYCEYTINGSLSNVIGLPMEIISELLFDRYILENFDYTLNKLDYIDYYRSSVRVLAYQNKHYYLLKCYTFDKKETFYLTIGGGYNYFEDKIESLKKEALEEAGLELSAINKIANVIEYSHNKRIINYNKLTTHAYYHAEITNISEPSYVEYESELIIGIETFIIDDAIKILEKQYMYFHDLEYPIANMTECDLFAFRKIKELKDE